MKSRKELAGILKAGVEDGDTDTVWFVIGELEGESDPVTEIIKARRIAYMEALDDARNDVPIGDDEHYESDDFYEGAIQVLTDLLLEIAGK
jgi:hypothetical protein